MSKENPFDPGATGIDRIEHAEIADLKLWLLNIPPRAPRHAVGNLSDHLSDDIHSRNAASGMIAVNASITHNDDAIGDREDLSQSVGNEDCGDATRLEPAHAIEKPRRLLVSECGRRLVKNEQFDFLGERPRDHHELLGRKIQRAHLRIGVDIELKVDPAPRKLRAVRAATSIKPQRVGSAFRQMFSATLISGTMLIS